MFFVMPFSEKVKLAVKHRAHFRCCYCENIHCVEVHHIQPQSEGGDDTEDNAAPLCPNCHEIYGANQTKRKLIKEKRDWWYEQCDNKRYTTDPEVIERLQEQLKNVATKDDLDHYLSEMTDLVRIIADKPGRTIKEKTEEISYVTTSVTSVVSINALRLALSFLPPLVTGTDGRKGLQDLSEPRQ